jgi:hypothetical protein
MSFMMQPSRRICLLFTGVVKAAGVQANDGQR